MYKETCNKSQEIQDSKVGAWSEEQNPSTMEEGFETW